MPTNTPATFQITLPSPAGMLCIGLAFYAVMFVIAPIDYAYGGTVLSWGVLLAYTTAMFAGLILGFRRFKGVRLLARLNTRACLRVIWIMFAFGMIGFAARIADRAQRGSSIAADFVTNAKAIQSEGFGPLAVIGTTLAPILIFLPLLVLCKRSAGHRHITDWIVLIMGPAYPVFELALLGGRSLFLTALTLMLLFALFTRYLRLRPLHVIPLALALVGVIWLGGSVFWDRTTQMGVDPVDSLSDSAYAEFVPLKPSFGAYIRQNSDSTTGFLGYALVNFSQYFTHGPLEFLYLVDNFNSYHTLGTQQVFLPSKLVSKVLDLGNYEEWVYDTQVRVGVYITLLGPIFYDFGAAGGTVFCLVFGLLWGLIGRRVRHGGGWWLPMYIYGCVVLLFSPVANFIVTGNSQSDLLVCLMLAFVLKSLRAIEIIGVVPKPAR